MGGVRKRGHIRRRGERSWAVVIDLSTEPGERKQKWYSVKGTEEDAQQKLTALLGERDRAALTNTPARLTVGALLGEWLAHVKPTVRGYTWTRYQTIANKYLVPALGAYKLAKLTPAVIDRAYRAWLTGGSVRRQGQALSPTTVRQHHAVLHRALGYAVRKNLLGRNPADAAEPPQVTKHEITPLDEAQTATLLAAVAGTAWEIPTLLAVATGARRGELLALRWSDVNLKASTVAIRRAAEQQADGTVSFKPTKNEKGRAIVLPAFAVAALKRHRATHAEQQRGATWRTDLDLVLPRPGTPGEPWPPFAFKAGFRSWCQRHGFPSLRFHDLRHGHASHLLRQEVPLKVVSERLGHSTIGITADLYTHVLEGMDRDAAAKLNRAIKIRPRRPRARSRGAAMKATGS